MKLNRVDSLRFIYKGRQHTMKIKFHRFIYRDIPVYCSNDISEYEVLQFDDKSVVVIINYKYIENMDNTFLQIGITDKLLRYAFENKDNDIIDLHLTQYFGYSNTIKYINSNKSDVNNSRVKFIESLAGSHKLFSVDTVENIVSNIKYVEIAEVES